MFTNTVAVRTAVVHAADGIRYTASASDEAELSAQLAAYVASRCDDMLWPASALEVRRLIEAGREADAIATYFANVGQRWDEERLERS